MAQRISMVSGVAQVSVYGAQKYAVHAKLDPKALASRQIGIDEVSSAIQTGNVNLPTGILYGTHQAYTVQVNGQLNKAADYGPLIVAYRNGAPVRLRDLGRVVDGVENDKTASWYYDAKGLRRGIILAIQRQPGTNTVEVVDSINQLMPSFRAVMPPRSISTVLRPVGFHPLFGRRCEVHVVPGAGAGHSGYLPFPAQSFGNSYSQHGAAHVDRGHVRRDVSAGISLDNLSLMALTLSVGFVVDDAIVMLENIVRHMEMGERPMEAAFRGARGDRLHDRFDDPVAGGGVYPGAVHERHSGPAAARICRDHQRGDSGFGLRVAQPHAHAVQPLSARGEGKQHGRLWTLFETILRWAAAALRSHVAGHATAQVRHHGAFL